MPAVKGRAWRASCRDRLSHAGGALALALLLAPGVAGAQLLDGLGGPAGYGEPCPGLGPCDDCASSAVDLAPAFPEGICLGDPNLLHRRAFINNNGSVTLGAPFGSYEPRGFPVATAPMIAPFWADVDTRPGGAPARNAVYCHLSPERLVATWVRVGYRGATNDRSNTFQVVLSRDPSCGEVTVDLAYARCEWTSADTAGGDGGLGGREAVAGIDLGNNRDSYQLRARQPEGLCATLTGPSNTDTPGRWRFRLRGCEVAGRCEGAGTPCATGLFGRCSAGVTRCSDATDGGVACVPAAVPLAETCNGEDDDCDGRADDGAQCPAGSVCALGRCVARCLPELGCAAGTVCDLDAGVCVEPGCEGRSCAPDEVCVAGLCRGGCADLRCPNGYACRAGRCVDVCEGVTCSGRARCVAREVGGEPRGVCELPCSCWGCPAGEVCVDGACVARACEAVRCPDGETCAAGRCVARCAGVQCPRGERCAAGRCEALTDAGVDAGSRADVPDAGDAGDAGPPRMLRANEGCGCRSGAAPAGGAAGWVLAVLLAMRGRAAPGTRARRARPSRAPW